MSFARWKGDSNSAHRRSSMRKIELHSKGAQNKRSRSLELLLVLDHISCFQRFLFDPFNWNLIIRTARLLRGSSSEIFCSRICRLNLFAFDWKLSEDSDEPPGPVRQRPFQPNVQLNKRSLTNSAQFFSCFGCRNFWEALQAAGPCLRIEKPSCCPNKNSPLS